MPIARSWRRMAVAAAVLLLGLAAVPASAAGSAVPRPQRIFVFAYDNTHPEDIAAMPSLQAFLQGAAAVPWHSVLISHTGPDYVAMAGGQYPRRSGVIDNSFLAAGTASSWRFWESPAADGRPTVLSPPFWPVFNQGGTSVGVVGWGDSVLENAADAKLQQQVHPEHFAGGASNPNDYIGYAVYYADGRRAFGAPSLPWLNAAVGPLRTWSELQTPTVLKATLAMQRQGINVTYSYIESPHAGRSKDGYTDRLQVADAAWKQFFADLQAMGVGPDNSLFIFTTDEADHYNASGTLSTSLPAWLEDNPGHKLPTGTVQMGGSGNTRLYLSDPARLLDLEEAMVTVPGWQYLLPPESQALAQVAEPGTPRAPSLVALPTADRNYVLSPGSKEWQPAATNLWNHGTVDPEINDLWFYARGPGIQTGAVAAWADHTDLLPTLAYALGLPEPDYVDGRPVFELWQQQPPGADDLHRLGEALKQINSPLNSFGRAGLALGSKLVRLDAAHLGAGSKLREALGPLVTQRDAAAAQLRRLISAGVAGQPPAAADVSAALQAAAQVQQRLQSLDQAADTALRGAGIDTTGAAAPAVGSWRYIAAVLVLAGVGWLMNRRHRRLWR